MRIWEFNETLSERLFSWNIVNVFVGLILSLLKPFWQGIGSQSVGWGLINIAIAIVGSRVADRRYRNLTDPLDIEVTLRESRNLRRILWVNTFLDVIYVLGGLRLAQTRGKKDQMWRGMGIGIVIQGAMLFIFDLIHARAVPDES